MRAKARLLAGKVLRRSEQNFVRPYRLPNQFRICNHNATNRFNHCSRNFSNSSPSLQGSQEQYSRASKHCFSRLDSRALIEVKGADSREYLQGLVTNDVFHLEEDADGRRAIYAAFLSPKGRMIAEVIIYRVAADAFLIDCATECVNDVGRLLKMYKLRRHVDISLVSDEYDVIQIMSSSGQTSDPDHPDPSTMQIRDSLRQDASNALVVFDPRWIGLGLRVICCSETTDVKEVLLSSGYAQTEAETYRKWRTWHGIAEGAECTNMIPLEMNVEKLRGVSFNKGCYTGQELTARTHNKGMVRKRLLPVRMSATLPTTSSDNANTTEEFLLPKWLDDISESSTDISKDKIEFVNTDERSKSPGKIVAAHMSKDSSAGYGLAMIRLEEHVGVQDRFLRPGHLSANGMNVWVSHLPFWWTQ